MIMKKQYAQEMVLIIIFFFCFLGTSFALDEVDFDNKVNEMIAERDITDEKEIAKIKLQVRGILLMKERMIYSAIQTPCAKEISRFCNNNMSISETIECIKNNRNQVAESCEKELAKQLGSIPLRTSEVYKGVKLPQGTVFYYPDPFDKNTLAILSENIEHNGIHFKKGQMYFHEAGISSGTLAGEQIVNGIKLSNRISFHKTGKLRSGLLVENTDFEGIQYKGGREIVFLENGEVESGVLAEDTAFKGIQFKGGKEIHFFSKNKVRYGILAKTTSINGKVYETGQTIYFNQDGIFRDAYY